MKTNWHSQNHTLIATRGSITVSVDVPVDGSFTNAKLWLKSLRLCIARCDVRLAGAEVRARV